MSDTCSVLLIFKWCIIQMNRWWRQKIKVDAILGSETLEQKQKPTACTHVNYNLCIFVCVRVHVCCVCLCVCEHVYITGL